MVLCAGSVRVCPACMLGQAEPGSIQSNQGLPALLMSLHTPPYEALGTLSSPVHVHA